MVKNKTFGSFKNLKMCTEVDFLAKARKDMGVPKFGQSKTPKDAKNHPPKSFLKNVEIKFFFLNFEKKIFF